MEHSRLRLPPLSATTHGSYNTLYHAVVFHSCSHSQSLPLLYRFFTYNYLSETIPKQDTQVAELGRRALLGFCSSAVSDTCSNSIRVVKVYKQSHPEQLTYTQVVRNVIKESGVSGLFFRGLETKILANGLQGILFSVLWKQFEEVLFPKT